MWGTRVIRFPRWLEVGKLSVLHPTDESLLLLKERPARGAIRVPYGPTALSIGKSILPERAVRFLEADDVQYLKVPHLRDDSCRFLGRLQKLTRLVLRPNVSDRSAGAIGQIEELEELVVVGEGLTDAGLTELGSLSGLRHLVVSSPNITSSGLVGLVAALPRLEFLGISGSALIDPSLPSGLVETRDAGCRSLKRISLGYCPGLNPADFAQVGLQVRSSTALAQVDEREMLRVAPWASGSRAYELAKQARRQKSTSAA